MNKVLYYELQNNIFNIIISVLCIMIELCICNSFKGFSVAILTASNVIVSVLLINLSFYMCDKRIKKYTEKNSCDISLSDSNL